MGYNGFTEKKKLSNMKYLKQFSRVTVCFTPQEKELIAKKAAEEKKTIPKYIRSRLGLADTPRADSRTDLEEYKEDADNQDDNMHDIE